MSDRKINVRILRFNPQKDQKAYFKSYEVPYKKNRTVLNVLNYIYRNLDSSIAYYSSCRMGKCGGCTIKINGKAKLACTTLVKGDLNLEPLDNFQVIKDLVVKR